MGQGVRERLREGLQGVQDRFPGATELVAALLGRMREEPLVGILCSVALHVLLIALLLYVGGPGKTYSVKRGEALFVELPEIKDQAPRGNPAARTPGAPAAPPPPRPPVAQAEPRPPAAQASPSAPKPAEARPRAPEQPRVTSAPPRPAEPARERSVPATSPAPRPPEPPSDAKDALPTPPAQETRPAPTPPAPPVGSEPPRAASGSQVAAVPPAPRDPVFDLRSLGHGGSGGGADGRAGIEGDPVPLDTADPKYSDYLLRVKRQIEAKMVYPCIKDTGMQTCEYKSVELMLEFGIRKDGNLAFVALRHSSGYQIMDEASATAVKLASPFPLVPDSVSKTGFPILARFRYHVVTTLH